MLDGAMGAVLEDLLPSERDLEQVWRGFHAAWVGASEALADAQERLLERERAGTAQGFDRMLVHMLRTQERHCFAVLERFERRMHEFRSRAAAFRPGYR
jgi:hypothetical protein